MLTSKKIKGGCMAQRILTMRKIKEILRLKWALGLSDRQVGASLKIGHSTVGEYVKRAERAGLDWTQAETMPEVALKEKLFPVKKGDPAVRPQPDWQQMEVELQGRGVTRMLLWQEYITEHPDGYGYSQFCEHYRRWGKTQEKPVLRIPKKMGEEAQVDYAGQTMAIIDPKSGEITKVQIFVGVLSASGLIYAKRIPVKAHRTGRAPMCACSISSVALPGFYGQTTSKPGSRSRTSTNPTSTPPIMNWPCITGWP